MHEESPGDGTAVEAAGGGDELPAVVVDLDGTLVLTDTLFETLVALIRKRPATLLSLPVWLCRGRIFLKSEVARRVAVSAEGLPYRSDLVEYLRTQKALGRRIVLATAAHRSIAEDVAAHLGLFDLVLASSDSVNLKGAKKCEELVNRFGVRGFDYAGDSDADTAVWAASRIGHVAGGSHGLPDQALAAGARQGINFAGPRAGLKTWIRALRVHQWVKNLLVFVPALLNRHIDGEILGALTIAFLAFSLLASGSYLVNDLFDLSADRRHWQKSKRPLASGKISIRTGMTVAALLLTTGLLAGLAVSVQLALCLAAYLALTLAYSFFLKGKPILDVIVLAMLYTLRVYSGGLVGQASVTAWLFQFSMFLFLSLAFLKRYSELLALRRQRDPQAPGRGYRVRDLSIISQAGVGSGLLSGLVLALYVNEQEIHSVYPHPEMLWGVCPLFVYWIVRMWLVAHRGNMWVDPILFAFRDKVSYIAGFLIVIFVLLAIAPHV